MIGVGIFFVNKSNVEIIIIVYILKFIFSLSNWLIVVIIIKLVVVIFILVKKCFIKGIFFEVFYKGNMKNINNIFGKKILKLLIIFVRKFRLLLLNDFVDINEVKLNNGLGIVWLIV